MSDVGDGLSRTAGCMAACRAGPGRQGAGAGGRQAWPVTGRAVHGVHGNTAFLRTSHLKLPLTGAGATELTEGR